MTEDEQMRFWRGEFGNDYTVRNSPSPDAIRNRIAMWAQILAPLAARPPASILEVGANVGLNISALHVLTSASLHAVEPNENARAILAKSGYLPEQNVHDARANELPFDTGSIDLVFSCTVLIHVAPEQLEDTCKELHRVSRRYIGCIEYFSATPEEKLYRGHQGKLFKRDFGSYWWDLYPNLRLIDYGFLWKRVTGLDDFTFWLFEKT